ncbi:mediator of RNA polymerase II transcription subunit 15-like [Ostrinia furnacalis]|uniref:mediator of RNA polymerase II transcription subunit 15-like n=1 Tax=Ostrinia furnacalis TaxID=93504 RepID=UPI00103D317D|nr:mediator of RNA polymerase II transcription subunit 15-like [Ostrinia furnacalis]
MPQDDPGSPQIEFIDFEHCPGPSGSQLREPLVPTDQSDHTASQALRESVEHRVQSQHYQSASSQARQISEQSVERRVQSQQSQPASSQARQISEQSVERRVQSQQSQPASSQARQISEQSVPRRRRRRRQEITEPEDPSLRRATERLEALEHASAQATREHAQATNRLAAALEALGDRLKNPFKIILEDQPQMEHRVKRRRIIIDSDSE